MIIKTVEKSKFENMFIKVIMQGIVNKILEKNINIIIAFNKLI